VYGPGETPSLLTDPTAIIPIREEPDPRKFFEGMMPKLADNLLRVQ
jgi:hypothetical protein